MHEMDAFERQIAAVVRQATRAPREVDGPAIVRSVSARPVRWGISSNLGVTRFAVAGAVVALFGALMLAGLLARWSEDAPPAPGGTVPPAATARPIELPAVIPGGVESGTLETPLGAARWVRLSSDARTFPSNLWGVITTPDGYVMLESTLDSSSPTLWRSPDLMSWASEPLGIDVGSPWLVDVGGLYWLSDDERHGSLWRSHDLETWEKLDLDRLARPGPDGYAWGFRPSAPVAYDGTTLVPFEWAADYRRLTDGLAVAEGLRWPDLRQTKPGVYGLYGLGSSAGPPHASLRFEEAGDGVRIVDAEDGTELAVHENISMEFVERLLSPGGIPPIQGYAMVEGESLVDMAPWEDAGPQDREEALSADDTGFWRYTLEPDGHVHVRHSVDGREWTESDVIGDGPGEPTGIRSLWAVGGGVRIQDDYADWAATDDGRWERQPDAEYTVAHRVGSGWVEGLLSAMDGLDEGVLVASVRVWMGDGDPIPLDITDLGLVAMDCGGGEGLVSANTLVSFIDEGCDGSRDLWIVTFDDVPA